MPYIYPEEVEHVRRLLLEEKKEEAFEILEGFEKTDNFTLRFHGGLFYFCLGNFEKVFEIAGRILEESQRVKNYFASFDSIYLKYFCFFFMGDHFEQQIEMVDLGEKFLKLAPNNPPIERKIREAEFSIMKGTNLMIEGKFDLALDLLEEAGVSCEQDERHFNLGYAAVFNPISVCYLRKGEIDKALERRKKGLALLLELKGSKAIPGVVPVTIKAMFFLGLGTIYFQKGEFGKAEEHFIESLKLYRNIQLTTYVGSTLYFLIRLTLRKKSINQARDYLKLFHKFNVERGEGEISFYYQLCNALILKSSPRLHDKTEAEKILRDLLNKVEQGDIMPHFSDEIFVSIHLCELLLSELEMTNEMTVLGEIEPIIISLLKYAETRRSYYWFVEVKILQAKLSLITFEMVKSQRFLTQAQQIAEKYDLNRLTIRIAQENEEFQQKSVQWEKLKENDAPMTERLKLARLNDQIEGVLQSSQNLPTQVIDEKVTISKETKICLVCRGEVLKFSYICACGAIYCENCARALTTLENVCWVCEEPIDPLKPAKILDDKNKREIADKK